VGREKRIEPYTSRRPLRGGGFFCHGITKRVDKGDEEGYSINKRYYAAQDSELNTEQRVER